MSLNFSFGKTNNSIHSIITILTGYPVDHNADQWDG